MSKEADLESKTPSQIESPISLGGDIGGKVGCLFSILYAILGLVIELILSGSDFAGIGLIGISLILILFIVIPPATFLGLFTGFFIGWLAKIFAPRVSLRRFALLSAVACAIIIILLHAAVFGFPTDTGDTTGSNNVLGFHMIEEYYFVIGIPSLIYIVTGGWLGRKLHQKLIS